MSLDLPENYTGPMPEGWSGGQAIAKWWRGRIIHLYRLCKPCAECGAEMRIDVTRAAVLGTVKNAGLHLKRCTACRERSKALGTNSRPRVEGEQIETRQEPWARPEPQREMEKHAFSNGASSGGPITDETLRAANATMREELEGLYKLNRELRERLAKYEPERMPWG